MNIKTNNELYFFSDEHDTGCDKVRLNAPHALHQTDTNCEAEGIYKFHELRLLTNANAKA